MAEAKEQQAGSEQEMDSKQRASSRQHARKLSAEKETGMSVEAMGEHHHKEAWQEHHMECGRIRAEGVGGN